MIEKKETLKEVKQIIEDELTKILDYSSPAVYDDVESCVRCISYYMNKLIDDRRETNSTLIEALGFIQDIKRSLTSENLCYYKEEDKFKDWR